MSNPPPTSGRSNRIKGRLDGLLTATGSLIIGTQIEQIQRRTRRTVVMDTQPPADVLRKCHAQSQSPLFDSVPAEIRNIIFEHVLTPYEDMSKQYPTTAYYYRPAHRAPIISSLSLLRSCRRAWLEASGFVTELPKQTYWFTRGPHDKFTDVNYLNQIEESHRYYELVDRFAHSRLELKHVHFYTQMWFVSVLANELRLYFNPKRLENRPRMRQIMRPRTFTLTIRHSDWGNWELDQPLEIRKEWVQRILDSPSLRYLETFHLELETLEKQKHQLDAIVDELKGLVGCDRAVGSVRSGLTVREDPTIARWTGDSHIGGKKHPIYQDLSTLDYYVVTLTWRSEVRAADQSTQTAIAERSESSASVAGQNGSAESPWKRLVGGAEKGQAKCRAAADEQERLWREQGILLKFEELENAS